MRKWTAMLLVGCMLAGVMSGCSWNETIPPDAVVEEPVTLGFQFDLPEEGEEIAIIRTESGDMYVRLFPEQAPKAVENFKTLAKSGYYDGVLFHRIIKDMFVQTGDPTGTGRGGESIWGRSFEDEFSVDYHNIRGALSMANAGPSTNGSQFFIVQAKEVDEGLISQMEQLSDRGFPTECVEDYKALGGTPWLDFKHTVFGQVVEGMDVVDSIASVKTGYADKPVEDVVILGIDVETL